MKRSATPDWPMAAQSARTNPWGPAPASTTRSSGARHAGAGRGANERQCALVGHELAREANPDTVG